MRLWISGLICLALSACATKLPDPEPDQDMLSIYEEETGHVAIQSGSTRRQITYQDDHLEDMTAYTRSVYNETENLFSWLPNPTLFFYVTPHLVGEEGLPVPGYTVPFKMYERDHFALPNEVTPNAPQ